MAELFGLSLPFLLILVGAGLMIMEAFAPGAHFIVVGIALLAAGLVGLLLGGILPAAVLPIVLAAIVLVAGGVALYGYRQFDFYGGKGTGQTSDSKSLQGKTGRVTKRVTKRTGEVKLDSGGFNPYYQARALDGEIPEGEDVMVVDPGGGNVLTVESLSVFKDEIDEELAADRLRGEHENGDSDRDAGDVDHDSDRETDRESA
jgi:membrane protein implicated in regulation of membrane protease activity